MRFPGEKKESSHFDGPFEGKNNVTLKIGEKPRGAQCRLLRAGNHDRDPHQFFPMAHRLFVEAKGKPVASPIS